MIKQPNGLEQQMKSDTHSKPNIPISASGKNVLVVEDELRMREMLAKALREMGFTATLAANAEAAVRLLGTAVFDILILDLNLPGMSGLDFLQLVRQKQNDIQVIILTGFGDLDSARKAIHLDVVEFLAKPCSLGNLEIAMDRASRRRKGQIIEHASLEQPESRQPDLKNTPPNTSDNNAPLSMEEIEQNTIIDALKRNQGRRAATAKELGISLRKLYYRLGEYQRKGLLENVIEE